MEIQKTPNAWSCMPTALAMVMDLQLSEVLEGLGHDGSEVVNNGLREPFCRKAFHPQEILDFCLDRGWFCAIIESEPKSMHDKYIYNHDLGYMLRKYMGKFNGLIFGNCGHIGHAVAFDHSTQTIYDPKGYSYPLGRAPDAGFRARDFMIVEKRNGVV